MWCTGINVEVFICCVGVGIKVYICVSIRIKVFSWYSSAVGYYWCRNSRPRAQKFFLLGLEQVCIYSFACYAYYRGFHPCWFLPFQSIPAFFFRSLSRVFCLLAVASTDSCVGPQNEIGHPAHCYRHLMQVSMLSACRIWIGSKKCIIVFLGPCSEIVDIIWVVVWEKEACGVMTCEMDN